MEDDIVVVVVVVTVEVEACADEPPPGDGRRAGAGGLALEPRAVAAAVHGDDEHGCGLRDCGARGEMAAAGLRMGGGRAGVAAPCVYIWERETSVGGGWFGGFGMKKIIFFFAKQEKK